MKTTKISFRNDRNNDYAAVVEMLQDGYGPHLKAALWDCICRYLTSSLRAGEVPGEAMADAHWALCELFERLMRDEYGIDLWATGEPAGAADEPLPQPVAMI